MIYVHATHHSWLLKEGHLVDGPGFSPDLGTNLNQYLIANAPNVLSFYDSIAKHNLRRYGYLMYE